MTDPTGMPPTNFDPCFELVNAVAASAYIVDQIMTQIDTAITTLDERLHNLEQCREANPPTVPPAAWAPSAIDQKQAKIAALRVAIAEFRD